MKLPSFRKFSGKSFNSSSRYSEKENFHLKKKKKVFEKAENFENNYCNKNLFASRS